MNKNIENLIIYQIALRTFTPEGTLNAAKDRLHYVASLGVDIVYLCALCKEENDPDQSTWSERQIASKTQNPKNPYKASDYFHVDEEFGTDDDLKEFIKAAHDLGLMVFLDMVFLHCGRSAVFIKDHPDFVERNADGSTLVGKEWPFARLNFQNPELRAYLTSVMEYYITDFNVDGFRCDVADRVPLSFWEEAFEKLRKLKPDLLTLNEGMIPEYLDKAFDYCYARYWRNEIRALFRGTGSVTAFRECCLAERETFDDKVRRRTRCVDNHDQASDVGLLRNEIVMTGRGVDAALVVQNTYDGIPFLWNGVEFADQAENCMFSNRFYGKRSAMDWSYAFTKKGMERMELVKKLHALHHTEPCITRGLVQWINNDRPDDVISYKKEYQDEVLTVIVNAKNKDLSVTVESDLPTDSILMCYGTKLDGSTLHFKPYGYVITKHKTQSN